MKRKKEADESSSGPRDGLNQKRTRSGTQTVSIRGGTEERHSETPDTDKRSFRMKTHTRQDDKRYTPDDLQDDERNGWDEEISVDGDAEDTYEASDTTPLEKRDGSLQILEKLSVNGTTPLKTQSQTLFSTPVKINGTSDTPRLERHADRSARRKSTRTMIERTVLGNTSDNEEEDEDVAQHIYGSEEEEDEHSQEDPDLNGQFTPSVPETSSKRGRAKGSKNRKRSPTPLQDLPPHELYFSQNRGGRSKTSNNSLSTLELLDHEEYFKLAREYNDPHKEDLAFIQELHASSFKQWEFELSQNFNLCLYGWGSKRSILMKFAEQVYKSNVHHENHKIVIVNGYVHNLAIRDVLGTVAAALFDRALKLGSQPAEMLENLLAVLEEDKAKKITVIIHSIDGLALRKPASQTILSRLSSHSQVHFVASADHPSFPLLWDSSLRSSFNFLLHDCTTFQPYTSEVDVVDEVHELLGRSGRRVGGREGVSFVLKSLPENAKNLFRVLIGEQLTVMDENMGADFGGGDDEDDDNNEQRQANSRKNEAGVEYRVLYQKAVEEFICSNEMNFRTLLKE